MNTPNTESGKLTELIMAEVQTRLPMAVSQYNAIYESSLKVLSSHRAQQVEDLSLALSDAISTYGEKSEILVTAERQEAWTAALKRSGV